MDERERSDGPLMVVDEGDGDVEVAELNDLHHRPQLADSDILFRIRIQKLAKVIVSIPLSSLLFCFFTAMAFQHKEVNQTVCRVFNVIPSISAITGIAPQCYVWRIGVALHCTPRFFIALLYHDNYRCRAGAVSTAQRTTYLRWAAAAFWLNLIENASLIGVTYISNRDNYAVHEKIFVCFMVSSMAYMLVNTVVFRRSRPCFTNKELKSYRWKVALFVGTVVSSMGLLYFFYRHRRFCEEMAFSYFSFCEYCIALCNMGYHMTLVWDFPEDEVKVTSTRTKTPCISTTQAAVALPVTAAAVNSNSTRTPPKILKAD